MEADIVPASCGSTFSSAPLWASMLAWGVSSLRFSLGGVPVKATDLRSLSSCSFLLAVGGGRNYRAVCMVTIKRNVNIQYLALFAIRLHLPHSIHIPTCHCYRRPRSILAYTVGRTILVWQCLPPSNWSWYRCTSRISTSLRSRF